LIKWQDSFSNLTQENLFMAATLNQVGNSPVNMTVLSCIVAIGMAQLLYASPLTLLVAEKLSHLSEQSIRAFKKSISDSPVICLSAGIGFAAHHFVVKPLLGSELLATLRFEDSFKAAQFVGAAFLMKSALSPFIDEVMNENSSLDRARYKIKNTTVRHLIPLAITTLAARSYDPQVTLVPNVLLAVGLFGVMNLLGRAYKQCMLHERVQEVVNRLYGI
jgi:hypothetical protein